MVLAITKFASDYLAESAHRLGVGYMMVKPCDVSAIVSRLREMTELYGSTEPVRQDPWVTVSSVLLTLGISTKLRGYSYLREAILETMRCPGQMVTKELYPKVAKTCGATNTQVERSIRSAISKAWEQRDEAVWWQFFRIDGEGKLERPTNAIFISCIAERIGMEE